MSNVSTPLGSPRTRRAAPLLAPPEAGPSRPSSPTSSRRIHRHPSLLSTPQHPGCVLCSLVASIPSTHSSYDEDIVRSPSPTARSTFLRDETTSPTSPTGSYPQPFSRRQSTLGGTDSGVTTVNGREMVYHDAEITVYRAAGKERLCGEGRHLIVVMNRHLENVYDLSPADVPILSNMLDTARDILLQLPSGSRDAESGAKNKDLHIGFVGSMKRDPHSPHAHLHAHALLGSMDTSLPGSSFWRRNVIFGSMNWWSVEDLRAEIRESTSNNRVKSGYKDRSRPPIDRVPDAGAATGLPNALQPDPYEDAPMSASASMGMQRSDSRLSSSSSKGLLAPPSTSRYQPMHGRRISEGSNSSFESSAGTARDDDGYEAVDLGKGKGRMV